MNAGAGTTEAREGPGPWAARRQRAAAGRVAGAGEDLAEPTRPCGQAPLGVERRLPNRAEALWMRLRGGQRLPPASAAGALLAPPFAAQALRVDLFPGGAGAVTHVGADLAQMGFAAPTNELVMAGLRADDATLDMGARMAALAVSAIAAETPLHLDSDFDPDIGAPRPGLLFRAVALPFAPEAGDGTSGLAVALLSWRHLLPAAETAALYRELRAAIGWMNQNSR